MHTTTTASRACVYLSILSLFSLHSLTLFPLSLLPHYTFIPWSAAHLISWLADRYG